MEAAEGSKARKNILSSAGHEEGANLYCNFGTDIEFEVSLFSMLLFTSLAALFTSFASLGSPFGSTDQEAPSMLGVGAMCMYETRLV